MNVFPWRYTVPLLTFLAVTGCSKDDAPVKAAKAAEVFVTTPITDEVTDYQDFTGRLSSIKTVSIRARVTGYVKDAPFKEGDVVHEGDILFTIDDRTYKADLDQATANLNLAEADRSVHEKNAARAARLVSSRAISQEDYDVALAVFDKDKASVESMRAIKERAELYLSWTKVTAPLTGRISQRLVDPGNLISADNTILTTIVAEDPMYVYFDVDERTLENLTGSTAAKLSPGAMERDFPLLMRLANEDDYTHKGVVNFIDNQVNSGTGTIRMRGVFTNPRGFFKAGMFARVRLPIGVPYQTILVPDEALMSDQGRKYVYVLSEKNEVVYRRVDLGQSVGDLRVIKKGLKEGERVIVTGQQRVRPGAQVEPKLQTPPQRPNASLGNLLTFNRPAPAGGPAKVQAAGAQ